MHRSAYLEAAAVAVDLLADPAVAKNWAEPSALAEFSVGGLAGHLARQIHLVAELVDAPAADGVVVQVRSCGICGTDLH
ncbi:maleylpyruvate isomerase N-terminal domain-containing protein, partial [Asanoa sp. NPDC050611]|uniref:maleylpyruvate isomerase N-terminal domain-containing protein n=1 Tax=Asanoa sp. NPDC050611 TaxID=3157098 RepID=UPI0033F8E24A